MAVRQGLTPRWCNTRVKEAGQNASALWRPMAPGGRKNEERVLNLPWLINKVSIKQQSDRRLFWYRAVDSVALAKQIELLFAFSRHKRMLTPTTTSFMQRPASFLGLSALRCLARWVCGMGPQTELICIFLGALVTPKRSSLRPNHCHARANADATPGQLAAALHSPGRSFQLLLR